MKLCIHLCAIIEFFVIVVVTSRRILRTESLYPSRLVPRQQAYLPTPLYRGHSQFTPIMAEHAAILSPSDQEKPLSNTHKNLAVSDILNKIREVNIFASLTRDFESLSNRLEDGSTNVTVLAPTNMAIEKLPRKPWENPEDYTAYGDDEAYAGEAGRERASNNLRRFIASHIVPGEPWSEKKEMSSLSGQKVFWEKDTSGKIHIYPGKIEVSEVAARVSNGEVWILNGVIENQS